MPTLSLSAELQQTLSCRHITKLNGGRVFTTFMSVGNRIGGEWAKLIRLYRAAIERAGKFEPTPAGGSVA